VPSEVVVWGESIIPEPLKNCQIFCAGWEQKKTKMAAVWNEMFLSIQVRKRNYIYDKTEIKESAIE
jgi:hypothetical protein